jgi:hypothetical protein
MSGALARWCCRKNDETKSGSLKHLEVKGMSNEGPSNYYAYLGPLGQVVCDQVSFFASKDGFPIGTYNSYDEAIESLAWKGRAKAGGSHTDQR